MHAMGPNVAGVLGSAVEETASEPMQHTQLDAKTARELLDAAQIELSRGSSTEISPTSRLTT